MIWHKVTHLFLNPEKNYGRITRTSAESIRREGRNSHCSALYTTLKTYVHLPHCSEIRSGSHVCWRRYGVRLCSCSKQRYPSPPTTMSGLTVMRPYYLTCNSSSGNGYLEVAEQCAWNHKWVHSIKRLYPKSFVPLCKVPHNGENYRTVI